MRLVREERGLAGFSVLRYLLIIVLLGVAAIEGGSIIFTTIGLQNAADAAAVEAADVWERTQDLGAARAAALSTLATREQDEARIPSASFEADRYDPFEVRFTVKKRASTLVVHRIGFLEGLAQVEVRASARPIDAGV
jgi:hypothetical protein